MTFDPFCETCGHRHPSGACLGEAGVLRDHLLRMHGTDYGASDEQLQATARRARAYVGGRRLSWTHIAAGWLREAEKGGTR